MATKEGVIKRLNILARDGDKEATLAWFSSLSPEEREYVFEYMNAVVTNWTAAFDEIRIALDRMAAVITRFVDGFSPEMKELLANYEGEQCH